VAERDALHPEFADLWPGSRGRVDERLSDLERGTRALEAGTLGEEDRAAARAAAHKLVGTLGTYGLMATAERLRDIEDAFDDPARADAAEVRAGLDAVAHAVDSA
jgi:chemotaxis protein histidine kinase CheA